MRKLLVFVVVFACLASSCRPTLGVDDTAQYTVTYVANAADAIGSPPVDASKYSTGDRVVIRPASQLTRVNFALTGWNTASDGSGTGYAPSGFFQMKAAHVTLWAQWTSTATYSITYDPNGSTAGTVPVDAGAYPAGATVTCPTTSTLEKLDLVVVSWNTLANGLGTSYAPGVSFSMPANALKLYAVYGPAPVVADVYVLTDSGESGTIEHYRLRKDLEFDAPLSPAIGTGGGIVTSPDGLHLYAGVSGAMNQWNIASGGSATNPVQFVNSSLNGYTAAMTMISDGSAIFYTDGSTTMIRLDLDTSNFANSTLMIRGLPLYWVNRLVAHPTLPVTYAESWSGNFLAEFDFDGAQSAPTVGLNIIAPNLYASPLVFTPDASLAFGINHSGASALPNGTAICYYRLHPDGSFYPSLSTGDVDFTSDNVNFGVVLRDIVINTAGNILYVSGSDGNVRAVRILSNGLPDNTGLLQTISTRASIATLKYLPSGYLIGLCPTEGYVVLWKVNVDGTLSEKGEFAETNPTALAFIVR